MEKHKCKICFRTFTNGRALGGHMRSHFVHRFNKSVVEQPVSEEEDICSIQSSSSSENLDFQGIESETRCSINLEVCISTPEVKEHESMSSMSAEEEMAYCLMMLHRDSWSRKGNNELRTNTTDHKQKQKLSISTKVKAKYICDTCGKVFKSYQALGGHRASHKKGLITSRGLKIEEKESEERLAEKNHQCTVCLKVFASGQALGGHKRTHLSGLETNYLVNSPSHTVKSLIDLNLPPPVDEDNDNEISQIVSQS